MTDRFAIALFVALGAGCGATISFPDCEDEAMRTASGAIDECDLQACEAAFGDGCTLCMVNQSLPPQYVDDDGKAWTVYDFCPDWGMDTGGED